MPKMTEKQLISRDSKRDLGTELLQSVRQMKAGHAARTWKVTTNREGKTSLVRQSRTSAIKRVNK